MIVGFINYKTIDKIKKNLNIPLQKIIVDNFSDEIELEAVRTCVSANAQTTLIERENYGFASGVNSIIDYARRNNERFVTIINPDIEIKDQILFSKQLETTIKYMLEDNVSLLELEVEDGKDHETQSLRFGFFEMYNIFNRRKLPRYNRIKGAAFILNLSLIPKNLIFEEEFFMYTEEVAFSHQLIFGGKRIRKSNFASSLTHYRPSYTANKFVHFYLTRNLYVYSAIMEGKLLYKNIIFITGYCLLKIIRKPKMTNVYVRAIFSGIRGRSGREDDLF